MNRNWQKILLFPLALLYGLVIRIRNLFFDTGILKSTRFDLPVITVGNITVGGTGKTPHVEYLVRVLTSHYDIAVLSRGYKRKTKTFLIVEPSDEIDTSGDEPLQIKLKYPNITVAVDRKRVNGINQILLRNPATDVIILDDAYQHRYIEAGLSILLINFNRLISHDYLLPAGRLREHRSSVKRADIVIITKSPYDLTPDGIKSISGEIGITPSQHLYFTGLRYDKPISIFNKAKSGITMDQIRNELGNVLLLTGIAEPEPLISYLRENNLKLTHLVYPDHHHYTNKDCRKIKDKYCGLPEGKRCLITTEKDAIRIRESMNENYFPDDRLYYLRVNVAFLNIDAGGEFNKYILDYVKENRRNSSFS